MSRLKHPKDARRTHTRTPAWKYDRKNPTTGMGRGRDTIANYRPAR